MSNRHFITDSEENCLDMLSPELLELYNNLTEEDEIDLLDEYEIFISKSDNSEDNQSDESTDKYNFLSNYLSNKLKELEHDKEIRNNAISIDVAPDNLTAKIKIGLIPKSQPPFTREEIVEHIEAAGVVHGRNFQVVDKLVHKPVYNVPFEIARANMPVDGVDGTFILNFEDKESKGPEENEQGIIDYKNIKMLNNVKKDDLLAEIIPPLEGVIGTNVLGKDIPYKKPKEANITLGENVRLDEETNKIYSVCDGAVKFVKNRIFVSNILTVKAVDYSTGNIDFNGAVVVKGNVLSGFKIKTTDSIVIYGLVEDAVLEAGNDISIRGGINCGLNRAGYIQAGRNVKMAFAENVRINAGGNINAECILNCEVEAFGNIDAVNIIGGKVMSHQDVIADCIGNNSERYTEITLRSINPLEEEREKLEMNLEEAKARYEENSRNIQDLFVQDIPDSQKRILSSKYFIIDKKINKDFADLRSRIREIEEEILKQEDSQFIVRVKNKIYPNVFLTIDNCKYVVRDEIKFCEFKKQGADVYMTGIL